MKLSRCFTVCKQSIFCLFLLLLYIPLFSQVQTQKPVTIKLHDNLGGYLESLPVGYDANPKKKYPIIISFHGIGEVGDGSANSLKDVAKNGITKLIQQGRFPASFRSGGEDFSFIVISPQYVRAVGVEAFVGEVIKHCLQKYRVDEERIYLTGLSMGGGVSYAYASSSKAAADQLAATVFVCPAAAVSNTRSKLLATSGLPVWATHSRGDGVVNSNVSVNLVNGINANNPDPAARLTIFESNSHDAWTKTYDPNYRENGLNVYEWMLQYKRSAAVPIPPVANAGTAQTITLPVNYITLEGTGSSAAGRIVSYAWSKLSGPASGNIVTRSAAKTNVTDLTEGAYQFQLKVTDERGGTATSVVSIVVKPALLPPVANAGIAQTITLPVNTITLNGTGSSAPSGTISSYAWSLISGPTSPVILSPSNAITNVSGLQAGTYVVQLKVTDNNGKSATATITITVKAAPLPPTANAGKDILLTLPLNSVTLDGSKSSSGNGSIKNFQWTKLSGPDGGSITDEKLPVAKAIDLVEGVYEFQLEVTDEAGLRATAKLVVTVKPMSIAPVAVAGDNKNIMLPLNYITLNGDRSSAQGKIVSYSWQQLSGPTAARIESQNNITTVVSGLVAGVYRFELKVVDDKGLSATDIVTVEVNAPPPPIANAGDDIEITLPQTTVILDGSRSRSGSGSIIEYTWKLVSGNEVLILNPAQAVTEVSQLKEGSYQFEITVRSDNGTIAADTMLVRVRAATEPVKAVVSDTITISLPVNEVILDGSASLGEISSFSWNKVSGPDGAVLENNTGAKVVLKNLSEGNYVYELEVTDGKSISKASIRISVKPAPIPPIAAAKPDNTPDVRIYPNPLQSEGIIELTGLLKGRTIVSVFNMGGKLEKRTEFLKDDITVSEKLDFSSLPKGIYFIEVVVDYQFKKVLQTIKF